MWKRKQGVQWELPDDLSEQQRAFRDAVLEFSQGFEPTLLFAEPDAVCARILLGVAQMQPTSSPFLVSVMELVALERTPEASVSFARSLDKALERELKRAKVDPPFAKAMVAVLGATPMFLPKGWSVSASALPQYLNKKQQVFASDGGKTRPVEVRHCTLLAENDKNIVVGSKENTPFGELRCELRDGGVEVGLYKANKLEGRILRLQPPAESPLLREGAAVPERYFSTVVNEFYCTPWDDGTEMDSLWTVHGLRTKGTLENSLSVRQ